MVMRYHWGLAVGHRYTHDSISGSASTSHNCNGTNLHHAHIDNDLDNNNADVEEQSSAIASGSKERQARTSDALGPGDSGHSQACAPEQTESHEIGSDDGHSQEEVDDPLSLEMSLEDREFEDWQIDSDDCDSNLDSDGDYDCDSDPMDVDVVSDIEEY